MIDKAKLFENIKIVLLICGIMAAVHVLNIITGGYFRSFGVNPREIGSIYTILLYPWIHADINHLLGNLSVMAVLIFLCLLQGLRYFVKASAIIILISGILLWIFGGSGIHIGASGWIFGLWSLVIALAWFDRGFVNIAIAIAVGLYYGGIIFYGLIPIQTGVSEEGHLFGLIAGIAAAAILSRKKPLPALKPREPDVKFWS